jgi:hypothetical protein
MKLERGIPVGYLTATDAEELFILVRSGPTVASRGTLWQRRINETEYRACLVCKDDESVEQVIISGPNTQYLHCRTAVREDRLLASSAIATYRLSDAEVVARIGEDDLLSLRPTLSRATIYSLVQGQTLDSRVRCVAMFGTNDGFSESWLVEIDVFTKQPSLMSKLPQAFW